jgi:hypothetical protein
MYIVSNYIEQERWENAFADLSHLNFSFFNEYQPTYEELKKNPINILLIGSEPNEYFGNHDYAVRNHHLFSVVLTWSTKVLNQVPNALQVTYGESWWQNRPFEYTETEKEFRVSFLRGGLLKLHGHSIRHELFDRQNEITAPIQFWDKLGERGNFEQWREDKIKTFRPYQYSVCIENSSRENYFSEKITDCILNKTIPIYWGCSNIGDFYDIDGIIQVNNADEIIKVINNLDPDYYKSKAYTIEANYQRAFEYKDYVSNIKEKIVDIFKMNDVI